MNESFLEARQVTKRYANHTALEEVSIQVPKGQVFGLLGPNGAGKTTLIRIINRITAPDAGEVWFDGHLSQPQDIYSIGYLPEERGLYKKMKVGEQAVYLAQLKGLSRQEAKKRLTDWFDRFDIMPWWNKKLEELSKGMQQKVQFVITVLHRPPLLIFDEPFSGFDPVNAELLKREILKLKEEGHTIIFSTHNMASVEEICDHIALINHSQVVLQGAVQDIRSQYKSNQYELTVRSGNPLPESDAFEVVDSQVVDAQTVSYKLRKLTSISNSEMLSLIGAQTEIIQFSECIPSMNDIFIRTVEGKI
ncbi:ABC transporter ATP-binding protein [uncultured Bacteroides sp.]|uniref:ABC transporter ATP-binding protein n=1 Tax=uncultured Bacteroides sp. TaxID=162156 RepID=UPI00280AEB82|nr:ABC transporter ATP-binding protein [uncultured Bacteroides sp.]